MRFQSRLSHSNLCALGILHALRCASDDLTERLNEATSLEQDRELARDNAEEERIELLGGVARELRTMLSSRGITDAQVYIDLLEHLAGLTAEGSFTASPASLQ
jgi:hypothetical protein